MRGPGACDGTCPLQRQLPRLRRYAQRLTDALGYVQAGQPSYICSPFLDSYHTIWFELHEELITSAGRTREQEAAAGRACGVPELCRSP
jgi:hypothetical protein